jgi:hypothetical protein
MSSPTLNLIAALLKTGIRTIVIKVDKRRVVR